MGYRTDYVVFFASGSFTLTSYTNYSSRTKGKTWDGTIEFWSTTNNAWTVWNGTTAIQSSNQETDWGTGYALKLRGTGNTKLNLTNNARWYIDRTGIWWTTVEIYCRGNIEILFDYQSVNNNQHPTIGSYACYNLFASNPYIKSTFDMSSVVTLPDYGFRGMYQSCPKLTEASDLSATTIGEHCYEYMFYNCTSLTTAPSISATTISDHCCYGMFYDCTNLTTPPLELPASTLADYCYQYMFYNCTSLVNPPELPATTLATYCYSQMFYDCTSLSTAPELPATTLANYCYYAMFYDCTSLITSPELPATILADYCYQYMFRGCSSLRTAPELPATVMAPYCYSTMFSRCESLIQAPELQSTSLAEYCYEAMFYNCTSLRTTPELPATTLATSCYQNMFSQCESLIQVPELQSTSLAEHCYESMFYNCISLSVPPELPATTLATSCYQNMFSGSGVQISSTQTALFNTEYRIPATGTGTSATDALTDMFDSNTIGTPLINTTYYIRDGSTDYKVTKSELESIANAIRKVSNKHEPIEYPFGYLEEIGQLGSQTFYTGSFFPPDNLGENGDIYVKIGV